ncbi:hypothetical protein H311_02625 [Anncaliia algerae PRA109]|nr:hypothetical protein H311_02625 [Anncaliia algerae PRA109]
MAEWEEKSKENIKYKGIKQTKKKLSVIETIYKLIGYNLKTIGLLFKDLKKRKVNSLNRESCEGLIEDCKGIKKRVSFILKDKERFKLFYKNYSFKFTYTEAFFIWFFLKKKKKKAFLNIF